MSSLNSGSKEKRLYADYTGVPIIEDRLYNLIMGGVVIYGLAINVLLCATCADFVDNINPIAFIIGYIVCVLLGCFITYHYDIPAISFLGYNLVVVPVGLVVASVVKYYGGLDSGIVLQAFICTLVITCCMVVLGTTMPNFFSGIGSILLSCLLGLFIAEIVMLLLGFEQIISSWIAAILFSLYIGYDFYNSQQYTKTVDNAIDCALDIYLDVINLFIRILEILGHNNNSRSRR
jgi:hypothetical protein